MSKRANPMAVKASLTYTVDEAAIALDKSPATIRNWVKDGLPIMAKSKPYLILGADLCNHIKTKSKAEKSPIGWDELYCFSCRAGCKPLGMVVEAFPNTTKTTRLKGHCGRCGSNAGVLRSNAQIHALAQTFQINTGGNSEAY